MDPIMFLLAQATPPDAPRAVEISSDGVVVQNSSPTAWDTLAANAANDIVPILAITLGIGIAFFAILMGTIKSVARTKAREESRREIAAYVAEGSISPADAQNLLNAGGKDDERCG
jgi:hypothetical protein